MATSLNFAFLEVHDRELVEISSLAERYFAGDPSTCLIKLRQFSELLAQLTAAKTNQFIPDESQGQLLRRLKESFAISGLIKEHFYSLKDVGNDAVHSRIGNHRLALSHLKYAHTLAIWFHRSFGDRNFVAPEFVPPPTSPTLPETIKGLIAELSEKARANRQEAESAQAILAEERRLRVEAEAQAQAFKQKLAQVQAQAETLPVTETKALIQQAQVVAQSAKLDEQEIRLLIDRQLRDRGWEADTQTLRYSKGTRPEVGKNRAIAEWPLGNERVDYALFVGINLLGIIEAKAEDAVKAQTQTEAYVREAAAQYNVQPFAFFSDHYTTYFWERGKSAKRLVSGLFSPEDLQQLAHIRVHGTSLAATQINTKIAGRAYQQEAIRRICEAFEAAKGRTLLVMATGTGKTRTAMALIELFLQTNQAQKILFVADRDNLVQQALDDGFKEHLPHEPRDRIFTKNIDPTKRLYVVTQQTLDKCYHKFSPAFFDLIIFDEAHRSLFNKFKEVVDYFDAKMIELTATPANFVDRNTFLLFQCDDNLATYLYDYDQAVDNKVLVDFSLYRAQTHFQRQGIHGVDLTDEQRETLMQEGIDLDDVDFSGMELEKEVSNKDTLRKQWEEIMDVCFKDESGQLPAKTIIFALTQDHAFRLCRTFEEMYPQYSDLARVITHKTESKGRLTKQFEDQTNPRIAISVDMLDTGVDVPEAMNLVFMKPVRSRIKLWQMIGRGTRNQLIEDNRLDGVVSMPSGVFKPYAGVSMAILIFTKGAKTDRVWFYDMEHDGFSLDDKRQSVAENDIPDILDCWRNRSNPDFLAQKQARIAELKSHLEPLKEKRLGLEAEIHRLTFEAAIAPESDDQAREALETEQHFLAGLKEKIAPLQSELNRLNRQFWVTKEQVKANKYDLSASRYRQIEQDEVFYEVPKVTLERLLKLEHTMALEVAELERLLEG